MQIRMAFDRQTVRSIDADGRLHVEVSNISKATVNPYRGDEIPDSEALGLDPNKVYFLLRHPDELERGASTFNNLPLLSTHVPVSAFDPQKELIVGSTGTDAQFSAPYLRNSLVIWDAQAIGRVQSREQCEISCAYRYRADMTPGVYDGAPYDGVMRDLIGNHVALVEVGRAGPDVVVADGNPFSKVKRMKLTRVGLAVYAALGAAIRPKLAADAKMPDFSSALEGLKVKTLKPQEVATKVHAIVKTKLAADMEMSPEELACVVESASESATANDAEEDDEEEKKPKANDGEDPPAGPKDGASKPAQDAAVLGLIEKARNDGAADAVARMTAIRQAEREVQPFVGEVAAMDSADAVYRFALDSLGVDTKGMPAAALRHVLVNLPKPGTEKPPRTADTIAQDAASADDFAKRFPNARAPRAA